MPPASTARRWAYGWWWGLLVASVLALGWNVQQILRYEDVLEGPTVIIRARVLAFDQREDLVTVAWVDAFGVYARYTFTTTPTGEFGPGEQVWLGWDPDAPGMVLLFDDRATDGEDFYAAAFFLVLALLAIQVPWLVRFVGWWLAARGPARRYRAWLQPGRVPAVTAPVPWLRIEGNDVWYQPVMWEPWPADGPLDANRSVCLLGPGVTARWWWTCRVGGGCGRRVGRDAARPAGCERSAARCTRPRRRRAGPPPSVPWW